MIETAHSRFYVGTQKGVQRGKAKSIFHFEWKFLIEFPLEFISARKCKV